MGDLNEEIDAYQSENRSVRTGSSQENEIRRENRVEGHVQPSIAENRDRRFEFITNEMNARITQILVFL